MSDRTTVHEVKANDTVIRIQRRSAVTVMPQYSLQIGRLPRREADEYQHPSIAADDRLQPFMPVQLQPLVAGQSIELDRSLEDALKAAHDWIAADALEQAALIRQRAARR